MSGQSPHQSPRSEQVLDADRQVADAREDVRVGAERGQGVGEIAGMVGDAMLVAPSTARRRLKPSSAAQPEPGSRLLQAFQPVSRK